MDTLSTASVSLGAKGNCVLQRKFIFGMFGIFRKNELKKFYIFCMAEHSYIRLICEGCLCEILLRLYIRVCVIRVESDQEPRGLI